MNQHLSLYRDDGYGISISFEVYADNPRISFFIARRAGILLPLSPQARMQQEMENSSKPMTQSTKLSDSGSGDNSETRQR